MEKAEALLLQKTGLKVKPEMQAKFAVQVQRLMSQQGITDQDACVRLLNRSPEALQELIDFLTINETYFFREPTQIEVFVQTLVPEMLQRKLPGEKLRILSAGCSTGEEPYSLAMALAEIYKPAQVRERFLIMGVDIDHQAIQKARIGIYRKGSFRRFDNTLLERYFEPGPSRAYMLKPEIKQLVSFKECNLLETPYPDELTRMDAVFYRNVSIYFNPEIQRRIFHNLSDILTPGGFLIVSSTETLSHDFRLLNLVERNGVFLYVKTSPQRPRPIAPPQKVETRCIASPQSTASQQGAGGCPPTDRYAAALAQATTQSRSAALAALNQLIQDHPDFLPAKTLKAAILLHQAGTRTDEAQALCRSVLEKDPWNIEALLLMGIVARNKGDLPDAARRFKTVVYNRTDNWPAHFFLAGIYQDKGKTDLAVREYGIAARLLEKGKFADHGLAYFPLAFTQDQILHLCREHKKREV